MKITTFILFFCVLNFSAFPLSAESRDVFISKAGEVYLPHLMDTASEMSKISEKIKHGSGMMIATVVMGISFIPQLNSIDITNNVKGALFLDKHHHVQWALLAPDKNFGNNSNIQKSKQEKNENLYIKKINDKVLLTSSGEILKVDSDSLFRELPLAKENTSDLQLVLFPAKIIHAYPLFIKNASHNYLADNVAGKSDKLKQFLTQCKKVNADITIQNGIITFLADFFPDSGSNLDKLLTSQYKKETHLSFKQLLKLFNNSVDGDLDADSLQQLFNLNQNKGTGNLIKKCVSALTGDFTAFHDRLQIILKVNSDKINIDKLNK
jgi:hypothetical protein